MVPSRSNFLLVKPNDMLQNELSPNGLCYCVFKTQFPVSLRHLALKMEAYFFINHLNLDCIVMGLYSRPKRFPVQSENIDY